MSVQPSADPGYDGRYADERGDGWLAFAGALIGIAGVLNTIGGIAAIGDSKFYVHGAHYVFGSLHTWGWIVLLLGVAQILVAWGVWVRNQFARWVGVVALSLNAIASLLMIPAYPLWSLAIFTIDILAMYGLIAYGQRLEQG